jgi:hypothetical protein
MSIKEIINRNPIFIPTSLRRIIAEYGREDDFIQAIKLIESHVEKKHYFLGNYFYTFIYCIEGPHGFIDSTKSPFVRITTYYLDEMVSHFVDCIDELKILIVQDDWQKKLVCENLIYNNLIHNLHLELQAIIEG